MEKKSWLFRFLAGMWALLSAPMTVKNNAIRFTKNSRELWKIDIWPMWFVGTPAPVSVPQQAIIPGERKKPQQKPVLRITYDVVAQIIKTIGVNRAETGGPFGGGGDGSVITDYVFDTRSRKTAVTYSPDTEHLNNIFKNDWNPKGIRLRGFVHSHPAFSTTPSYGDEVYASRILAAIPDLDCLWLPIITTIQDTDRFQLTPWVAYRAENGVQLVRGMVEVVDMPVDAALNVLGVDIVRSLQPGLLLDQIVVGQPAGTQGTSNSMRSGSSNGRTGSTNSNGGSTVSSYSRGRILTNYPAKAEKIVKGTFGAPLPDENSAFSRVEKAYDLPLMKASRIIAIGAGGAAEFLEQIVRAGLGQVVLIDPDAVSATNLATQQCYFKDIGRPKVECIAERLRDINPNVKVLAIEKMLDDLTDMDIQKLAFDPLEGCAPKQTVLCGFTDSFFAQARVNRLALKFGIPSLMAQVYLEGRAGEVTFTHPDTTPACHCCVLSSRYKVFYEKGGKNDVTSDGTPIFSTTRLNSIKGFVLLALFHHGSGHPRWGNLLREIKNRNLIQFRLDPFLAKNLNLKVFDKVFANADQDRILFDETVWLPQVEDSPKNGFPTCPECHGTGNLRDSIGRFDDTRNRERNDKQSLAS
jgi:hypothetical protein